MLKIRVDFDDVLNDLYVYWIDMHYQCTGERIKNPEWDLHLVSEIGTDIYKYFEEDDFFLNISPKDGAIKMMNFIIQNFDYEIVSACNQEDGVKDKILFQKLEWLNTYIPAVETSRFHLTRGSKKKFEADIYLDDKPENLFEIKNKSKALSIMMNCPHNKLIDVNDLSVEHGVFIERAKNPEQALEILRNVLSFGSIEEYKRSNE